LTRVAEVGALAFAEPGVSLALVRAFGAPSGGLVTPADFSAPAVLDTAAARVERGDKTLLMAPWATQAEQVLGSGVAVCAVDVNGSFAALVIDTAPESALVEELELTAPLLAAPTLRGVARVAPGTALPTAAPIWIEHEANGSVVCVWCAPSALAPALADAPSFGIRRATASRTVEAADS
jgi:gamma-glutamyltranspeptidase/glutathione hydrolase